MSQQSGFAGGAAWMGDGGISPDRVIVRIAEPQPVSKKTEFKKE
jgi:hypothetical protein